MTRPRQCTTKIRARREETADEGVHYAFGAALGIACGMLAEAESRVTMGAGAAFGTAVVLIADDLAVSAFGWGKWPAQASLRTHAYGLASHLVFGFITEATRRVVRGALRGTWWALLGSNQRPTD
jgi:uncharacterized membrane protein YagU involved in acid resistance